MIRWLQGRNIIDGRTWKREAPNIIMVENQSKGRVPERKGTMIRHSPQGLVSKLTQKHPVCALLISYMSPRQSSGQSRLIIVLLLPESFRLFLTGAPRIIIKVILSLGSASGVTLSKFLYVKYFNLM